MNFVELACEQAIFTSIRTPTGEGYRIVAASAGLKPEEKQAITRNSPSHESICAPPEAAAEQTMGAAFYSLPTGRLCFAFSCLAGAEHTGRGGFRVYTANVVFGREDFARCGFNPFNIVRAMAAAGLTQPMLKPPQILPHLALKVSLNPMPGAGPFFPKEFSAAHRVCVLELALSGREVLVDMPQNWISATEAILLGLPGEMRESLSFSAGLRFSTNRKHRLQLLHEERNAVRSRGGIQHAEFIDVLAGAPPATRDSAWLQFVERHWRAADFGGLSRRTSRTFGSTKLQDIEEAGALYNLIDSLEKLPTLQTLELVSAQIRGKRSTDPDIIDEFLTRAGAALSQRVARDGTMERTQAWKPLLGLWRQSTEGTAFAMPIIKKLLDALSLVDAISAAEAALDLTRDVPTDTSRDELDAFIDTLLSRLGTFAGRHGGGENDRLYSLIAKWHRLRPNSPALTSLAVHPIS